jgi:hypothetical protein
MECGELRIITYGYVDIQIGVYVIARYKNIQKLCVVWKAKQKKQVA